MVKAGKEDSTRDKILDAARNHDSEGACRGQNAGHC